MAWELLLSTDYGLSSLLVIVFVIAMAVGFARFFSARMREEEAQGRK
ncbi:MAG: DUF3149 domain-containing protein [Accumulibacter sp.]|jgi:hypothetical protein